MKLPQTFLPERSLESCVERLVKPEGYLLNSCKSFLKKVLNVSSESYYSKTYNIGMGIAEGMCYNKEELETLSYHINYDMLNEFESVAEDFDHKSIFPTLGVYLSALANKILTDEKIITLSPKVPLACLGIFLEKGTLVINSDADSRVGFDMKGGKLILKKFPGSIIGALSKSGEIHIERDLGREIILLDYINLSDCKAKVYYKGDLVWFKGKQVKPWSLT